MGGVPERRQVTDEAGDPVDGLHPALAAWVRRAQVLLQSWLHLDQRCAVAFTVFALAQPRVVQHRDVRSGEGDLRGLHGPSQVGGEHRADALVPPTSIQLEGERAPPRG